MPHPIQRAVLLTALATALITPAQTPPPAYWKAHWIAAQPDKSTRLHAIPIFRREFTLDKQIRKATLRISGLGQYETHINGHNITDALLTPGWTDYRKHIFFDTYDVTGQLQNGPNAIGVLLGNGMYNVIETPGRYTKFANAPRQPKLILQLDIQFTDSTQQTIATDDSWTTAPGPITFSSTYGGEDYDARFEQSGWDTPNFRASTWQPAIPVSGPGGELIPESIPPIKSFETYVPKATTHPEPGITIYDLGQNFSGWPEITVQGHRGDHITLLPGELLNDKGRVTQKTANAYPDSQIAFNYTLKGGSPEHWIPRFSYTGFRYVELRTSPVQASLPPRILLLRGHFLHEAAPVEGHFTSSDQLLNRIHTLIDRAILSNTVSVLTDCPHREKLGWLEQTHLAGPSLLYNYDLHSLFAKISDDMQDAQLSNGLVPDIAPEYTVFDAGFRDSPEWGAAVVLTPWTAYQFYGDIAPLRAHYESMQKYAAYLHSRLQNNLLTFGLGDWYDIGPGDPGESQLTTKGLTATATYFELLTDLSRIATLLNHPEDAEKYLQESQIIKTAFNEKFFHPGTGEYDRGSQTANAMPLVLGLVPGSESATASARVLANLVADIRQHNNHVTAGDIGFHYVVRALTDNHRSDVLYDMLSRTDKPSYGDQLAHGATTLTEAWDANPASSQNHFMLGHAEEWFYRGLAGLDLDQSRSPDARIRIQPNPVGKIQSASATLNSNLGKIESSWARSADSLTLQITIPVTAKVALPSTSSAAIRINGNALASGMDIRTEGDTTTIHLPAGTYRITLPYAAAGFSQTAP